MNLSVPLEIERVLDKLARRDETSLSSKALELIRRAIDFEEDIVLLSVAQERVMSAKKSGYRSHKQVWK